MAGDQPWEHLDSAEAGGPEQQRQLESPEPLSESAGLEDPSFDDGNSISSESDGGKVTSSRKNPQKDVKPDRKRSILLEKIRREIESGIKEHEITAAKYKTDINSCKIDNEGTNATILHWIVKRVELHDKFSEPEVKAGLKLASLALEVDPQLLLGQDKVNNETALHLAVKNQHRYDLVRCLCSEVPSDIVQKAIAVQNIYGETCIHMAIVEDDLDIAEELIAVADPSTFALKRKDDFNGKAFPAGNGGNTPLHDAVDYELCVCQSGASCPHEPICEDFSEAERRSKEQMNQVLRIIRSLVTKNNKALTIKNAADESPYLYHLATRKKHEEPLTTSASEKGIVSVPTRRQTIDLTSGVSGSETPKNGETDSMSGSMLQPNPGETLRTAHVVNGVSRGGNLTKSTITRPTGPENPQKSADITLQKKDNACEIPESTFIADRVLEYLEESSFALGSFEKTCACFFGEKPGMHGHTPEQYRGWCLLIP
jgi:ankyrin repeat protein